MGFEVVGIILGIGVVVGVGGGGKGGGMVVVGGRFLLGSAGDELEEFGHDGEAGAEDDGCEFAYAVKEGVGMY